MSKIPKGCKPFNLQKALAGEPVVDGTGARVKVRMVGRPVVLVFDNGLPVLASEDGTNNIRSIFMAPKTKKVYVNLYHNAEGRVSTYDSSLKTQQFNTREEALENVHSLYIKTVEVEIPEED